MRVITGTARGKRLLTLEGDDVRPTTQRVKEAVFSIIQFDIEGRRVLDLFAGSGQMGIEALSRGAASAVFIDSSAQSVKVIRQNLERTGFSGKAVVLTQDHSSFLASELGTFDIAFLDPPYSKGFMGQALKKLPEKMNAGGLILCEHPKEEELPNKIGNGFSLYRTYRYGRICVSLYKGEGGA